MKLLQYQEYWSGPRILMAWCFSPRASVTTALITHQSVSSRLWVNHKRQDISIKVSLINTKRYIKRNHNVESTNSCYTISLRICWNLDTPHGTTMIIYSGKQGWYIIPRDHFVYPPSQRKTSLQCSVISHWMGVCTEWSLYTWAR